MNVVVCGEADLSRAVIGLVNQKWAVPLCPLKAWVVRILGNEDFLGKMCIFSCGLTLEYFCEKS